MRRSRISCAAPASGRCPDRSTRFLGKQVWRYDDVVDAACDHQAMDGFVAASVWYHLVGITLSPSRQSSLATFYRSHDLDTGTLVAHILRGPIFLQKRLIRPRRVAAPR
jgi:hypothetical protein